MKLHTKFTAVTFKMCHIKENICPRDITQVELVVVVGVFRDLGGLSR